MFVPFVVSTYLGIFYFTLGNLKFRSRLRGWPDTSCSDS